MISYGKLINLILLSGLWIVLASAKPHPPIIPSNSYEVRSMVTGFQMAKEILAKPLNQDQQKPLSDKAIKKWFRKKEWSTGLGIKAHSSINKRMFHDQYMANRKLWDSAFQFLQTRPLKEMLPGKYPIIGDQVFASITEAPSKPMTDLKWESHRQYIDLHYLISGKELIGISDTLHAKVTKPYTPDAMNYDATGKFHLADPEHFLLMFPSDIHVGNIKAEGYETVKKLVIKIKVAELSSPSISNRNP